MSRVGNQPISVPTGVEINISGENITVKGAKGSLSHVIPQEIVIEKDNALLNVKRANEERKSRELHGLTRTMVNNMILGVTQGFEKKLKIVGVGYRSTAKGKDLEMQLGFSHPVLIKAPEGITFDVAKDNTITVMGINKQSVGQVAADIRKLRKPEPYKGKGVMYTDERIIRKAGKKGAKK
ncbi:MAG: 50S ribosomal protein L6 [Nitrospinae bacterium]|nr:50S ribosomal protein L6 [Nitrospinota bacterium]